MKAFTVVILFAIPLSALSQIGTIKVRLGDDPLKSFPVAERYRYIEFLPGVVFGRDGKPIQYAKLNFQLISGNLESIQDSGDTVVVDNTDNRYPNVQVHSEFFQHTAKDEYFHVLMKNKEVKLVSKLRWMVIRREAIENEGLRVAVSSQQQSTRRDPTTGRVIANENLVYSKIMTYYLMDLDEDVDFVSKAGFSNAFPLHKKEIKAFISKNEIDFDKEQDLRKMFSYCVSLK